MVYILASESANNSTSVGEVSKTTEPFSSRKRESADGENDASATKKTASGIGLRFHVNLNLNLRLNLYGKIFGSIQL